MPENEFKSDACTVGHYFLNIMCEGCGKRVDVPVYCGNRFCSVCGVARRMRVRHRLKFLSDNVASPRDMNMKFLTLTIPSRPDVFEMTRYMLKSFRKLRSRSYWKKNVDGGAFVLEIKGRPGYWHVHIHIVMMADYMKFKDLVVQWLACSGGRGVWIKKIPTDRIVRYLSKYLTKPAVREDELLFVNDALKGLRLFSPFGSWYDINLAYKKPKAECPECHSTYWLPFDLFFGTHLNSYWKEVARPPPDVDPEPERCKLTKELTLQ